MSELVNDTAQFVKTGLKDNAFYRSLAFGILFSFVMTVVIGYFVGTLTFNRQFPWLQIVSQQYWVGIFFVTLSLVVAFGGYVSELRAREDILTPLRKKLVGTWEVRAQTWKIEQGKIELVARFNEFERI